MKHSILFCISILFSGVLFSQNAGIGVRGGYDYSNASVRAIFSDSLSNIPSRRQVGASGSFFIDWEIKKYFSIETHFQWTQRETFPVIERLMSGDIQDSSVISNIVEFPVLAKFQVGSNMLKAFAFGGPNFSFINSKFEEVRIVKDEDGTENITKTDLSKDSFETYEYSNLAGFGVRLKLNKIVISADYRYKFQFREADQIRSKGLTESLGSNVGIGIGYYW